MIGANFCISTLRCILLGALVAFGFSFVSCGPNDENGGGEPTLRCSPRCEAGDVCDTSQDPPVCIPDENAPDCRRDSDCEGGLVCRDGECVDLCADVSCPDGEQCVAAAGECEPIPEPDACALTPDLGGQLGNSCYGGVENPGFGSDDCRRGFCLPDSWATPSGPGFCHQLCFIEECPEFCGPDLVCAPLPGDPLSDEGWLLGVCIEEVQEGDRDLFEECGPELGWCLAEFSCVKHDRSRDIGTCLQDCSGADRAGCAGVEDKGGEIWNTHCVDFGDDQSACVIDCNSDADCPKSFVGVEGDGSEGSICQAVSGYGDSNICITK